MVTEPGRHPGNAPRGPEFRPPGRTRKQGCAESAGARCIAGGIGEFATNLPIRRQQQEVAMSESRPPVPPFTRESAVQKVQAAEDAWNSRDPQRVSLAYTADSQWRNRDLHIMGRGEIVAFDAEVAARTRLRAAHEPVGFPRQSHPTARNLNTDKTFRVVNSEEAISLCRTPLTPMLLHREQPEICALPGKHVNV
jgi:Protein of unknown function (DUF1348)